MTWVRRLLVLEVAVLVVTGVPLLWLYRPRAVTQFWHRSDGVGDWLRVGHALGSTALVWTALVAVVLVVAERTSRHRWPWVVGLFVLGMAFSFTGYLLPWDQLALYAVTVGTNMRGMFDAISGDVRFILVGNAEISKSTYATWLGVHTLALPLVGLAGLWLYRRRVGSRAHAADVGDAPLRRDDTVARHGDPQPHA